MSELLQLLTIFGCSAMLDMAVIAAAAGEGPSLLGIFFGRATGIIPLDKVPPPVTWVLTTLLVYQNIC